MKTCNSSLKIGEERTSILKGRFIGLAKEEAPVDLLKLTTLLPKN